jgi:class 3 adenylate cyclase
MIPILLSKKTTTTDNQTANTEAAPSVMPAYNGRVLAYLTSSITMAVGIIENHFDDYMIWFIPAAMLWPHLLYFIIRHLKLDQSSAARENTLLFDGIIVGVVIVLIDFSLSVTIFNLLMASFSFIVVGGMSVWLKGNLFLVASTIIASMIFGLDFAPDAPMLLDLVAGLSAGVYVSVTAYYTHQQAEALHKAKHQIQSQRELSISLSHKLAKYLSPQVWQSIFTGERDVRLETQRKRLSIFFSDIKGFTELSEEMEPEGLTELLNNYFNEMSQIALKYGGTIDKFIGDSIMIFFGDPTSRGAKEDTMACVSMAIEMRKHMKILRQKWQSQGIKTPLQIRIGISTGFSTVGNFGAENRMDYTIIGKEVNLASRLEALSEPGEILISYETFSLIKDKVMCRDKGEITVKGFARPVSIYQIVDLRRDIGAGQSFIEHETEGFAMYLDTGKVNEDNKEAIVTALERATEKLKDS